MSARDPETDRDLINDKFYVDPSNFQGHQYSIYKNVLMSKAMTEPSLYYDLQTEVIEQLNVQIAKDIYKKLFKLLTKGTLPDGTQMKIGPTNLNPCFPSQTAADFCIDAANTIDKIIKDATEVILPASHLDIARMQMEKKSSTSTIR
jgi:hypothetical protein